MTPRASAIALLCCLLAALPAGCKHAEKKKTAEEETKPKAADAREGGIVHGGGGRPGEVSGNAALIGIGEGVPSADSSGEASGKAGVGQSENASARSNKNGAAAPTAPSLAAANAGLVDQEGRVVTRGASALPPADALPTSAAAKQLWASAPLVPAKVEVEPNARLDAGRAAPDSVALNTKRGGEPSSREASSSARISSSDTPAVSARSRAESEPLVLGAATPTNNTEAPRVIRLATSASTAPPSKPAAVPIRLGSAGTENTNKQPSPFPARKDVLARLAASSAQHVALWSPVHPRGKAFTREEAIRLIENSADPRVLAIVLPEDDAAGWQALIDRTTAELHVAQWLADAGDEESARRERAARRAADQQADLAAREKLRDSFYRMLLGREGGGEK